MSGKRLKVKLLAISGSPRAGGNTEWLLDQAIDEVKKVAIEWGVEIEIDKYSTAGKFFLPCISCFKCVELGYCKRGEEPGDDFNELRDKWLDADAVLFAVPVYHMTIPGNIRNFMDRLGNSLFSYYKGKVPKALKVYGAITQGIHIFSGQEHTITDIINHSLLMGNVYVSGDMWENYIGAAGWTENDPLVTLDALKRYYDEGHFDAQVAVKAARSQGRRVAELAILIKAGALQFLEQLQRDDMYVALIKRLQSSIK
jgi:multimeric flavodoxin WrbA